jgi:hypothetical protein
MPYVNVDVLLAFVNFRGELEHRGRVLKVSQ